MSAWKEPPNWRHATPPSPSTASREEAEKIVLGTEGSIPKRAALVDSIASSLEALRREIERLEELAETRRKTNVDLFDECQRRGKAIEASEAALTAERAKREEAVAAERAACEWIARAIDSNRGNEKHIAAAIHARSTPDPVSLKQED